MTLKATLRENKTKKQTAIGAATNVGWSAVGSFVVWILHDIAGLEIGAHDAGVIVAFVFISGNAATRLLRDIWPIVYPMIEAWRNKQVRRLEK